MKFLIAILSIAGSAIVAEACPVQLQGFAAPSCGVVQQQVFPEQPSCGCADFRIQSAPVAFAVPQVHIQQFAVQHKVLAVPTCHSNVLALGHGCGSRVQVFGGHGRARILGGRSVTRQRTVIRSR